MWGCLGLLIVNLGLGTDYMDVYTSKSSTLYVVIYFIVCKLYLNKKSSKMWLKLYFKDIIKY